MMKKIIAAILPLMCLIGIAAALIVPEKDTDVLLNSGDVENIQHILESCTDDVRSVKLLGNGSDSPCVLINSKCFDLNGKTCKEPNDPHIFITIKEFDNTSEAAEKICVIYNGYFIMKANAERELGKLDGFYYSNFDTANDNYEAIAVCGGELYLAADDCVRHISGVLFDFFDEIEEMNTDE